MKSLLSLHTPQLTTFNWLNTTPIILPERQSKMTAKSSVVTMYPFASQYHPDMACVGYAFAYTGPINNQDIQVYCNRPIGRSTKPQKWRPVMFFTINGDKQAVTISNPIYATINGTKKPGINMQKQDILDHAIVEPFYVPVSEIEGRQELQANDTYLASAQTELQLLQLLLDATKQATESINTVIAIRKELDAIGVELTSN